LKRYARREHLEDEIEQVEFDLIGPSGITIDPYVWPIGIAPGSEIELCLWRDLGDGRRDVGVAERVREQRPPQWEQDARQREQDVRQREQDVRQREQDLRQREQDLRQRELGTRQRDVEQRERNVEQQERNVEQRERNVEQRERNVEQRERNMEQRERNVEQRERNVEQRERDVEQRERDVEQRERVVPRHDNCETQRQRASAALGEFDLSDAQIRKYRDCLSFFACRSSLVNCCKKACQ